MFFGFFKLYKWYQIPQSVSYFGFLVNDMKELNSAFFWSKSIIQESCRRFFSGKKINLAFYCLYSFVFLPAFTNFSELLLYIDFHKFFLSGVTRTLSNICEGALCGFSTVLNAPSVPCNKVLSIKLTLLGQNI